MHASGRVRREHARRLLVNSPSNPYKLDTEFDEVTNLDKRGDLRDCVRCERHKSMKAQV